jgi:ribonuclease D
MTVPMERPEPQETTAAPEADPASRAPRPDGPRRDSSQGGDRRRRYSRADHRARSHENAHAEGADDAGVADAPPRPHHPLVTNAPPSLVTTDEQLAGLIDHLRAAGSFAYDSEFIGELTYFPKLCLVQTATVERVALIDPLADLDLRPFWELIADRSVEKVVHAGQQDIEPVFRHIDRPAANVFDTQVSAGLAGLPYPLSLSKLVQEVAGARLGKGLTFSHWDQRPLSAMQLRYAADDVRYLPLVRNDLGKRLASLGHERWASEECAALCDPVLYRFDPDENYLRVRGASSLQPRNLAVLRELTIWRDATAREENVPPRAFLKDEILLDLARSPVKTVEKLDRVRGLPRPVEKAHGRTIVESTLRAMATPAPNLPAGREIEPTPTERFRSDSMWAAAQVLCAGRSIDPAVVLSRQDCGELYRALASGQDASDLRVMKGWRRDALGDRLARLFTGTEQALLRWSDGSLRVDVES